MCNWFCKLFGCKCQGKCDCYKEEAKTASVSPETKSNSSQPTDVEKKQ